MSINPTELQFAAISLGPTACEDSLLVEVGYDFNVEGSSFHTAGSRPPLVCDKEAEGRAPGLDLYPQSPDSFHQHLLQQGLILDYHMAGDLSWTSFTDPNGILIRVFDELPKQHTYIYSDEGLFWSTGELAVSVSEFKDSVNFWNHLGFIPKSGPARKHPWVTMSNGPCRIGLHQQLGWRGSFILFPIGSRCDIRAGASLEQPLPPDFYCARRGMSGLLAVFS